MYQGKDISVCKSLKYNDMQYKELFLKHMELYQQCKKSSHTNIDIFYSYILGRLKAHKLSGSHKYNVGYIWRWRLQELWLFLGPWVN